MSNPGVMTLAETEINGQSFRVEDNIGESIHIHMAAMRIECTIKDFLNVTEALVDIMERMVDVNGFDVGEYDAIWLSQICPILVELDEIEYIEKKISELITNRHNEDGTQEFCPIIQSRVSKALSGDYSEVNEWKQINYIDESNDSRVDDIFLSINEKGYNPPESGSWVVVMDNGRFVGDGCHRVSCLYKLNGDINIRLANWKTTRKLYSDEYMLFRFKKEREFIERQHRKQLFEKWICWEYGDEILRYFAKRDLQNKKIIIKGAGHHTVELLKILKGIPLDIVGIVGEWSDDSIKDFHHIGMDEDLREYEADMILISSYIYRHKMKEDVYKYEDKFEIYDFYEEGIGYGHFI